MTKEETKLVLAKLTILYPHFTVGDAVAGFKPTDVWHEMMEDMDFAKAMQALKVCTKKCKYPPTVADITEEYNVIIEEEKKVQGEIRQSYSNIRSYYPGCGELNYGWEEFKARAKTPEQARRLSQAIFAYVRQCESERKDVVDFAECIKGIRREIQGAEERLVIRND